MHFILLAGILVGKAEDRIILGEKMFLDGRNWNKYNYEELKQLFILYEEWSYSCCTVVVPKPDKIL